MAPPVVRLDDDGMQCYLGALWDPEELRKHLKARDSHDSSYGKIFDVVVSDLDRYRTLGPYQLEGGEGWCQCLGGDAL